MRPGRRTAPRLGAALAASALLASAAAAPAGAAAIAPRTFGVGTLASASPDGRSANPSVSPNGRVLAFDSTAANLAPDPNGHVRDVFVADFDTGRIVLVSRTRSGGSADGASGDPAVSGATRRVAFTSAARNLVPGDTNGKADVYVRDLVDGTLERVSVASNGAQANGPSREPAISEDGQFVVFTSEASNLVPGDTNGKADVFIRDLAARTTERVSVASNGREGNGDSSTPAISLDSQVVSFASKASNLVRGDTNRVPDVFVRELVDGSTERVSVSSSGRQQNRAVIEPFTQISHLSKDGRYVVFDSDASTLVKRDPNRDTDVFRRDRLKGTTALVSRNSAGRIGDNDSFAPTISPDGRYVTFESFAENLVRGDAPREDVFVRDLELGATTVVTVDAQGRPRGPELVRQLLQQPVLAAGAGYVAFVSSSDTLVPGDRNRVQDLFLRAIIPPDGRRTGEAVRIRNGRLHVPIAADDPHADRMLCRVDRRRPRVCALGRVKLPQGLRRGTHRLTLHVGGPGMLYDPTPVRFRFEMDATRPRVRITTPSRLLTRQGARLPSLGSLPVIRGRASDRSGITRVRVAVNLQTRRQRCLRFVGRRFARCGRRVTTWVRADGTRRWSLRLPRFPRAFVTIRVQAFDGAGNASPVRAGAVVVR